MGRPTDVREGKTLGRELVGIGGSLDPPRVNATYSNTTFENSLIPDGVASTV